MKKLTTFALSIFSIVSLQAVSAESAWRKLDENNAVLMTLPQGKVVIELAPQFSPNHVKHFKKLLEDKHYHNTSFYRVIDGFVAQAGPENGSFKDKSAPNIKMESEWDIDKSWNFTKIQSPDLFAEETGFKDGFAIAQNPSEKKAWLVHCPGTIAMARGNTPNSGSSHFYIPNGQAPRYLDRIMTIFGRVLYGMEHVQSIRRTSVIEGDSPVPQSEYTKILSMELMANVAKENKILLEIEDTSSAQFSEKIDRRKARPSAFFYKKPPPVLDICQTPVKVRKIN